MMIPSRRQRKAGLGVTSCEPQPADSNHWSTTMPMSDYYKRLRDKVGHELLIRFESDGRSMAATDVLEVAEPAQ